MDIKIRFNTEKDKSDINLPAWRVLVNGVEYLAESVNIQTKAWTTKDEVSPGIIKWHISCQGEVVWDENKRVCTVLSSTKENK